MRNGEKTKAIKLYRRSTGAGLAESNEFDEGLQRRTGLTCLRQVGPRAAQRLAFSAGKNVFFTMGTAPNVSNPSNSTVTIFRNHSRSICS